jgi:hypothetical protein
MRLVAAPALLACASDFGAFSALGGQDVRVPGVGVAPAQVSLELASEHGMVRVAPDEGAQWPGLVGSIWDVAQLSLRQVLIPDRLLGRVISAFRPIGFGPTPVGALFGSVLARTLGLRATFVVGAVVLAVVRCWRCRRSTPARWRPPASRPCRPADSPA